MGKKLQKIALLAAVLGLFVQTQSVFACEMMDLSGPLERCCCEDMPEALEAESGRGLDGCCEVSRELVLKSADSEASEPFIPASKSSTDPPPALFTAIAPVLDQPLKPATGGGHHLFPAFAPAHPGTRTYLATLRLRI